MAGSDTLAATASMAPLRLAESDAAAGLALSAEAGWNQTTADWRIFLGRGHTVGCRDASGRLVATAAALPYAAGQGWISMVLVTPTQRHQGLATRLMGECVQALTRDGIAPVLDATPAGAEVYRRIGFVPGFELERWEGETRLGDIADPGAAGAELPAATLVQLDTAATGLDRGFVLNDFLARPATRVWLAPARDGFVIVRAGHRAWQLGPLVASDEAAALVLLQRAMAAVAGRVFLDVPRRWTALAAWLAAQGFVRQRGFVRMALGAAPPAVPGQLFVLAGPEFG